MPSHLMKTKKETISYFKEKLASDEKWALRGLLRIYQYQTDHEKAIEQTNEYNGVGFTGADSNILSSFAKQYSSRGFLTEKQMFILKKRIPKYAGQLYNVSVTYCASKEHAAFSLPLPTSITSEDLSILMVNFCRDTGMLSPPSPDSCEGNNWS